MRLHFIRQSYLVFDAGCVSFAIGYTVHDEDVAFESIRGAM